MPERLDALAAKYLTTHPTELPILKAAADDASPWWRGASAWRSGWRSNPPGRRRRPMALHRITFHEQGGYTVTCRVRALVDRPTLLDLAVQKIWGPGTTGPGCQAPLPRGVYQQLYDDRGPEDVPRTECATVAITQVRRRGRMPECVSRLEGASLDFFAGNEVVSQILVASLNFRDEVVSVEYHK